MENITEYSNIGETIKSKIGRKLHIQSNHPIEIVKKLIYTYFNSLSDYKFKIFEDLEPFVSTEDNFDKLLIPKTHPARSKTDTYYLNEHTVLRTHTSAHQNQILQQGYSNFLVTGDVYRKDSIDRSHYPIFHQMEGVGKVPKNVNPINELKRILKGLVEHLFPNCEYRINGDYFPFTDPSFEIEVKYNNEWLEILGCGIMHKDIVANNSLEGEYWAFGLGLDRLAMKLFGISDIRYLWSEHKKFLSQFESGKIVKFKPYSILQPISKDISFWIPKENIVDAFDEFNKPVVKWVHENDFYEFIKQQ